MSKIRYTTMSLAVVVVGRVGQFSSNTTNTLLENLMSCLMKNIEHDLSTCLHIFKIRQFLLFKTLYLYSRQIGVIHE